MSTRTPFPKTDDEIRTECLLAAKQYCDSRKALGKFDPNECSDVALKTLKAEYRKARDYKKSTPLKPEHVEELNDIYNRIWYSIDHDARALALGYATKARSLEITKVSAEANIRATMLEAGFPDCSVVCQCYRAKVLITLPDSRYQAMFIVKYNDIMAGKLEQLVAEFIKFTHTVEQLPFTVKIWK